ncbi:MAG: Zn-dependent hydrolase [Lautropia sp.]
MSETRLPPIDEQRLWRRVETLASFTTPEVPWTRRAFSPLFRQARAWLRQEFADAGLAVVQDAAGNLIGRRPGLEDGRAPIATGSHCDTVVGGGRFDGIIGVLAGLEVAQALRDAGHALRHPFEVIDFLSEEPTDHGISCVGSRGMVGLLDHDMLAAIDPGGASLAQALTAIGGDPSALSRPLRNPGDLTAFVELHIEQGPVLESHRLPIGVVTGIVGIRRVMIRVAGRADHAGTTPMDIRCDALVGAARIISEVRRLACILGDGPDYVVATIGRLSVVPNAPNAVPAVVEMTLEVRSDRTEVLERFPEDLMGAVRADLDALRVSASVGQLSRSRPTECSAPVMAAIQRAADGLGYRTMTLPSGAGHDSTYVAMLAPVGMIFVPCLDGRSHCPEEWIEPSQLSAGARVLYQTICELDRDPPARSARI